MLNIAVLGCGRIGRMHADNIARHADAELAMVYDVHLLSASAVAEQHGVPAASSPQDIFSSGHVDAVLVATTTETHADFIEMAVAAGKPVLCEKPIDLSLARVNACAERISGSDVLIQLGFNRRFDPGHRAARQGLLNGDIGDLHQVIITSRDPEMPPRSYYESAGGLLRDMTIHDFDLARFILGETPTEVMAMGGRLIDPALMEELDDLDSAMIVMRTADGKQCQINNSRTAVYGYDQRLELLGSTGMLISDNRKRYELRRYSAQESETSQPYLHFFLERYHEAFMAEIAAFVEAVKNHKPAEVGFEDGRQALLLAEAAYLSIFEKRLVQVEEVFERLAQ
ncbi:inositol 2-dehydrogenase [Paracoccaceae bacterium]|nr:inositol 2-dehydrogenase [Paracoccaceae bacterium]